MKVVILAGGFGTRISEETAMSAKAARRDRRETDSLAHHEDLCRPRAQRLRRLLRLQGPSDQAVLQRLLRRELRRHDRSEEQSDRGAPQRGRTLAGDARRHGRGYDDRRPRPSRVRQHIGRETFCLTYGDGVSDIDITSAASSSTGITASSRPSLPCNPRAASVHSRSRPTAPRSRPSPKSRAATARGSMAASSCSSRRSSTISRATRPSGSRSRCATSRMRDELMRLPPYRLLAVHGHAARQAGAAEDVGRWRCAMGRLARQAAAPSLDQGRRAQAGS